MCGKRERAYLSFLRDWSCAFHWAFPVSKANFHPLQYTKLLIWILSLEKFTHWVKSKIRPYPSLGSLSFHQLQNSFCLDSRLISPEIQDFPDKASHCSFKNGFSGQRRCLLGKYYTQNAPGQFFGAIPIVRGKSGRIPSCPLRWSFYAPKLQPHCSYIRA